MNYAEFNSVDKRPNGRVVGLSHQNAQKMPLYEEDTYNNTFKCQVIRGLHQESPINQAFFSKQNMDHLNSLICKEVYKVSGGKYKIDKQSETELVIVMRGMYFQHGQNLEFDIKEQVKRLNRFVVEYSVPKIMTEIAQYLGYLNEVENMPNAIEHPTNVSNKGTRTLPSITTTF